MRSNANEENSGSGSDGAGEQGSTPPKPYDPRQGRPASQPPSAAPDSRDRAASQAAVPVSNFDFLKTSWPAFYQEARQAERFAHADPRASCFYSRRALELAVHWMYDNDTSSLREPYSKDLAAHLHDASFKRLVGPAVATKMDLVRRLGNAAVHRSAPVLPATALSALRELFHSLYWVARTYAVRPEVRPASALDFDTGVVPRPLSPQARLKKQAELKAEAEADARRYKKQAEELKQALAENAARAREIAELRAEIEAAKQANSQIQDTHDYDEQSTRDAFIDLLLKEAGWTVGATDCTIEHAITGMQTASGNGRVDYVLWSDDGKPLAVVEAKRTRRDPRDGQQQAKLYADALEAAYNRRPVIFFTNGYETYIWDDWNENPSSGYPPRQISGFLTKEQLLWRIQQRALRRSLSTYPTDPNIAGRPYQLRAIKRVGETYDRERMRQALLVMATGTGKTRTTVALVDQLSKAGWVKNVLFLADREALVIQAMKAFKEHLPNTPVASLLDDKNASARVFVSTYQTMMKQIDVTDSGGRRRFSSGHFDLIVIDEAHRSVYAKYGEIFNYFDSLLLGLTATPKDEIDRNTYKLFQLEDGVPTDSYGLDEAVADGYLVPPRAVKVPLKIMEHGIRYAELSEEERAEWDAKEWTEDGQVPDAIGRNDINKYVFNEDTVDKMLEVLVTEGHRVQGGDRLGKTIIFAKSNEHARFIEARYNANYPQGAGHTARVITYKETYRQSLIEDFSNAAKEPDIVISVDMLDTGIDVPEVVNLVFAKAVFSRTKFWQMIGRGTRLRPALFGPDETEPEHAKKNFRVFDFCGNIDFFNSEIAGNEGRQTVSLTERLLATQLDLLRSLDRRIQPDPARDGGADDIGTEHAVRWALAHRLNGVINGMSPDNFLVRPHRRAVEVYADFTAWYRIDDDAEAEIREKLIKLPSTYDPDADDRREDAKRFDLIAFRLQLAALEGGKEYDKLRMKIMEIADDLLGKVNIPAVSDQVDLLEALASDEWWQDATLPMLEDMRRRVRSLAGLVDDKAKRKIVYTDFEDELGEITEAELRGLPVGTDEQRFRQKARAYLLRHDDHPSVRKLRHAQQITVADLTALEEIFLSEGIASQEDLDVVREGAGLGLFVRGLCGLDPQAAQQAFAGFIGERQLTAAQIDFVKLIIDVVVRRGFLDNKDLYEGPFLDRAPGGPDDLFEDEEIDDLFIVFMNLRRTAQPSALAA
ncbi:DEAD/DEAH box helicase family protein [Streptomyces sp. NPDC032472]|uniref:DEAD/DEAH box helicase family protein n=1 Tax=Streptomyces sp. NPDC032472 TaxID=3155018 RepID=UPI0033CD5D7E